MTVAEQLEKAARRTGRGNLVAAGMKAFEPPARLYPLRSHPVQDALRNSTKRFCVVPAGRRSGKTELGKRKIVVEALRANNYPDPRFFAGAPTREQAKAIFWNDLKAMIPRALVVDKSETELMLRLRNGSEVCVIGLDKPERMEGRPWDGGVLDENANMKPGAFSENVRPALSDRKGWCWLTGVPEGRNHYYDIDKYAKSGVDPEWGSYHWVSADILDPAEIESARRVLDPLVFEQEYEASFINFEGRIYYPFLESTHAVHSLKYDPKGVLNLCFDFNVDPGTCVIAQEQYIPGQFARDENGLLDLSSPIAGTGIIGEVHIPRNSNTEAVCRRIVKDWGEHIGQVRCYGDASGGARGTAKTRGSDWDIILQELRPVFGERLTFRVPASNPAERARVNAVNSRLMSGDRTIRLMVDPAKAPQTIKDFEGVRALKGGSGEIDKKATPTLTHLTDGFGYYIAREFPLVKSTATVAPLSI